MSASDVEKVHAALAGDMDAAAALYAAYAPFCLSQARRAGAGDDAEDVVQQIFADLCAGRGWYISEAATPDGRLFKLLSAVVPHTVRYYQRRWRTKYHGPFPEFADPVAPLWTPANESPEARAHRLERGAVLKWAICGLPRRLREVATLRLVECLPGPEIEQRLGLRARSAPVYLMQIRDRIRPVVERFYALPERGCRSGHERMGAERPRSHITEWKRRQRGAARRRDRAQARAEARP